MAAGGLQDLREELGSAAHAAEAEEAATQVLYRFPAKVTLASGSTMMIPFTDREIPASRTFIYQPETNATRPLAAVRLTNDGDSALPAGLVTSFETAPTAQPTSQATRSFRCCRRERQSS